MSSPGSTSLGTIFISYRREDSAYPAGWLYDRLVGHFGADRAFKDIDSIQLGDDFAEIIGNAVGSCAVLLAVIDNKWLAVSDENGDRSLDDPDDFVRLEIETAFRRNVRVIPVLTGGARMPRASQLPRTIEKLASRQALELSRPAFTLILATWSLPWIGCCQRLEPEPPPIV